MERLIAKTIAGDTQAFAELTRRFQNIAFAYAVSRLGDFHLAEDAVQESFLIAYYGMGSLREPRAFPGWLRGIVRHECARLRRHHPTSVIPLERAETIVDPASDPVRQLEQRETAETVLNAVMALPTDLREVVTLYYLRDHSQREIANFLDLPIATVNNRLHAARTRLRRRMRILMTDTMQEKKLTNAFAKRIGEIVTVRGPLVDIAFDPDQAPELFDSLTAAGGAGAMHVVQRLGAKLSRCIAWDGAELTAGLDLGASTVAVQPLTDTMLETTVQGATDKRTHESKLLETGIKVIDLLCPLTAGGNVGLFGTSGIGKAVLTGELVRRLAADKRGINLFFLARPTEKEGIRNMVRVDSDILGTTDRVGSVETFWLLTERATDPDFAGASELLDAAIFCSPFQAMRGIWPAIDPLLSRSRLLDPAIVSEEHVAVATRVREALTAAKALTNDPKLAEYIALDAKVRAQECAKTYIEERLRELSDDERLLVERSRKIESFFAQPFLVAEPYIGRSGATVSRAETITVCRAILDGEYDTIPHTAFHFVGGIDEVLANVK